MRAEPALRDKNNALKKLSFDDMCCRMCGDAEFYSVVDLGMSPIANAYRASAQARESELFYPLHAVLCAQCRLMQLTCNIAPEQLFSGYRYFSSVASTMVEHARMYVVQMAERFALDANSLVVEIASNDGYLLRHVKALGVPALGIEPAENVAAIARARHGIETIARFFGEKLAHELAAQGRKADLIAANNVLAHVPDINDFVAGMARLLKPEGVVTVEFPDVANLLSEGQFDTIYHEHFSYLSLAVVQRLFALHGVRVFDAERIATHGGSLRVYACLSGAAHMPTLRLDALLKESPDTPEAYAGLQAKAERIKHELLRFLLKAQEEGKRVAGYGAPAKGNTLLNFCGIRPDLLAYTVDMNPEKQKCFLPGSGLPVYAPEMLRRDKPDYVLILPWNIRQEISVQHDYIRQWGGQFVTAVPELSVW